MVGLDSDARSAHIVMVYAGKNKPDWFFPFKHGEQILIPLGLIRRFIYQIHSFI